MKTQLFENCLAACLIVSDTREYEENGTSFVLDHLEESGVDSEDALQILYDLFLSCQSAAEAYLACFEEFNVQEEFDAYCENPASFGNARQIVMDLAAQAVSGQARAEDAATDWETIEKESLNQ